MSVGTQSTGQGHETSLAELVAAELGIPAERVELLQGDSQALPFGFGTGGSRTLLAAGSAARAACLRLIERARQMATHLLECALPDLRFTGGAFAVAGTDKSIHLFEIARAALRGDLPDALKEPLAEYATFTREVHTYPNGCHVCELEVDPDTGRIEIANYVSVDDFGRLINRQLVEGQVHGGVVQGIGQALLEQAVYDESTGQLLTASYMDYCLPRADDVPLFTTAFRENPCRTNPLGVKGAGEAGAIAAPAAVMNAVLDALASCGVRHLDMPATPGRVWTAIHRRR